MISGRVMRPDSIENEYRTMRRRFVQSLVAISACMALFGTAHAATFLVSNLNDNGAGTLRQAIVSANASPGPDTIEFNAGLSGTIVLSSGLPELTGELVISGPGAEIITVSGNSLYRPFSISNNSTVTIAGLTIANGQADIGGGISNKGELTVTECVLTDNNAQFDGGAIDNFGGTLIVSQSRVFDNTTDDLGVGAGLTNVEDGNVNIIDSTFTGNKAGFSGGAVDNLGTVTIERSTLSFNSADYGGAVENSGTLTIRNSTLSGNIAGELGGAIDNFKGETSVEFSTLAENTAASGAGIENTASITFKNSLVVNSIAGDNCVHDAGGTFTAQGANFTTDASCPGFTQVTTREINLGLLADNGGPTETHALLAASLAIDAALDCTLSDGTTSVAQDQRGQARPEGAECDSGAFEGPASDSETIFIDGFEKK
jgi:hypothetical protein